VRPSLKLTNQFELDLVEISPNAAWFVRSWITRNLFTNKKRDKILKAKSTQVVVKEIRFGPQTDEHDYEFKGRTPKNS
jgi:translation initiation factor IF-3